VEYPEYLTVVQMKHNMLTCAVSAVDMVVLLLWYTGSVTTFAEFRIRKQLKPYASF
jgi:hypothetical protein